MAGVVVLALMIIGFGAIPRFFEGGYRIRVEALDATGAPDVLVDLWQVSVRRDDLPADTGVGLGQKRRQASACVL